MFRFIVYSVGVVKIIKCGKDIVSDGLSWVRNEFLVCVRFSQVFFNFNDVKGGVHEAYSIPFVEWFDD